MSPVTILRSRLNLCSPSRSSYKRLSKAPKAPLSFCIVSTADPGVAVVGGGLSSDPYRREFYRRSAVRRRRHCSNAVPSRKASGLSLVRDVVPAGIGGI